MGPWGRGAGKQAGGVGETNLQLTKRLRMCRPQRMALSWNQATSVKALYTLYGKVRNALHSSAWGGVKVEVALGVALKDRCAYHLSVEKTGMLPVNSNSTGNKI